MKKIRELLSKKTDRRSFFLDENLVEYIEESSTATDQVQRSLIEETSTLGWVSRMQISHDQGNFLTMLVKATQAQFAVEVGTFTGYSALAIARGLPADAKLLCCDISEDWTDIARRHWREAGVEDKIDLVLAPALETLDELPLT